VAYSFVPVAAKGVAGATFLATDSDGYCAVVGGGQVKCWGYNHGGFGNTPGEAAGLLGNGSSEQFSDVPVNVKGLSGVKSLVSDVNG
jgi:hypothetical protein